MKGTCVDRFIGRHCKIITKESEENRAHVITGIVKGVDNDDGFVLVESLQGIACLSIKTVVAIKPKRL
jgi:hypothetical protein